MRVNNPKAELLQLQVLANAATVRQTSDAATQAAALEAAVTGDVAAASPTLRAELDAINERLNELEP